MKVLNNIKLLKAVGKAIGLNKLCRRLYDLLQKYRQNGLVSFKEKARVFGEFEDSFGNRVDLLMGLRDYLKPDWRIMLRPIQPLVALPPKERRIRLENCRKNMREIEHFLNVFSISLKGKEVVEIGAYDGATSYSLVYAGAKKVIATDMAAYYITQAPGGQVSDSAIEIKNAELGCLRNAYYLSNEAKSSRKVYFLEDDICHSSLESDFADAVFSWEVLEHLTNPLEGFRHMARILKIGGFAFHEYNPFFSINGGHSLCALDFLWGHARLNSVDFERYIGDVRPDEKQVALSFYRNNINRMTICDLRAYAEQAGLTPVAIIPWVERNILNLASYDVLSQCVRIYPSAELTDLVSPTVWVLFRKE